MSEKGNDNSCYGLGNYYEIHLNLFIFILSIYKYGLSCMY